MNETTLSASPTKHLTSWWKSFKARDDASNSSLGEGATGSSLNLARPTFPHMSRSSSAIPRAHMRSQEPRPPVTVSNQGKQVVIPFDVLDSPIFSTALSTSIKYASVKISLTDRDGDSFVYGHVPVIVAKCALYLKQNAREVDGIFRISGSSRRIRVLQDLFNAQPRFGKDIDWQGFSVHDAANVLRRYLNNLPEPIIPLKNYEAFRNNIRKNPKLIRYMESQAPIVNQELEGEREVVELSAEDSEAIENIVAGYQQLIFALPPINLQLLVYMLDLLAVFAAHSDQNRMPAFNLSAIFQPSILSHPDHDMMPEEYHLSRLVVEFMVSKSGVILRKVQTLALEEHEKIKSLRQSMQELNHDNGSNSDGLKKTPSNTGAVNSSSTSNSHQLSEPESEEANTEELLVPVLMSNGKVLDESAPEPYIQPQSQSHSHQSHHHHHGHQRRHSKSMSSAVPPVFTARNRILRPFQHDNDSGTSLRRLDPNDGSEDARKPKWRRSLMLLKPQDHTEQLLVGSPSSPSRSTSPSRSWFRRKHNE